LLPERWVVGEQVGGGGSGRLWAVWWAYVAIAYSHIMMGIKLMAE